MNETLLAAPSVTVTLLAARRARAAVVSVDTGDDARPGCPLEMRRTV